MPTHFEIIFLICIPLVAFLYAAVGHGGASGYLALMVLFNISPILMKPSALILNIFVSGMAFILFYKQGYFNWKLLLPFIILSIPLSFIGAKIPLDVHIYKIILAICLILATIRILGFKPSQKSNKNNTINWIPALIIGGILGLISGMIGIGGGILLSPILLLLGWASIKQTACISAGFIFLNSISGLAGTTISQTSFPSQIFLWTILALVGGTLGAWFGSKHFTANTLKYVLSIVLISACFKLLIS